MIKLGLDFDGIISYMPKFLKYVAQNDSITTYVITSKREKSKYEIMYMLDKLEIKYSEVYCLSDTITSNLETEIEHKVNKCNELGIDVFIDDKKDVVDALNKRTKVFALWRGA